eukprot:TRINITY_DN19791_c0_g3_i1.p1 TRINITY_DN19791_c0_g3~~TRINITY_DN19791_c0_g3_i1.p1  ORF type:complete len:421 (+),score=88.56 TRINITY_DN19791_c0_g3_i1:36-1265(+)
MGNALESYKCLNECASLEAGAELIDVDMHGHLDGDEFGQNEVLGMPIFTSTPVVDYSLWDRVYSENEAARREKHAKSRQLISAACEDNAPLVLELFAEEGGAVQMTEMHKALSLACGRGSLNVVRELVAIGLDVNCSADSSGMRPLHLAASSGHVGVCEFLLDALADANCRVKGLNALDLARKLGQDEAAQVIEKYLASLVNPAAYEGDPASRRAIVLPRVSAVLTEVILKSDFTTITVEKASIAKKEESKSTVESDEEHSYVTDTELISNATTWVAADTQNRSPADAESQGATKPGRSPKDADVQSSQSAFKAVPEPEFMAEAEATTEVEAEDAADAQAALPAYGAAEVALPAPGAALVELLAPAGVAAREDIVAEELEAIEAIALSKQPWENVPRDVSGADFVFENL